MDDERSHGTILSFSPCFGFQMAADFWKILRAYFKSHLPTELGADFIHLSRDQYDKSDCL